MSDFKRRKVDLPDEPETVISSEWLQALAKDIHATLQQNIEQRDRYPNEPLKFMDTETALYARVKALANVSELPELFGETAIISGVLEALVQHPNEDVVEQVVVALSDFVDHEYEPFQAGFVPWLLQSKIMNRLLTGKREWRKLVIQMIAELCEYEGYKEQVQAALCEDVLITMTRMNEQGDPWDSLEVMYDLAYKMVDLDKDTFCEKFGYGVEILLVALSRFTKEEYASTYEAIDDVVDALALCLSTQKGYDVIRHYEGFELFLLIMKNGDWGMKTFLKLGGLAMDSLNRRTNVEFATSIISSNYFLKNAFKYFRGNENPLVHVLMELMVFLPFGSDERVRVINRLMSKDAKALKMILKFAGKMDRQVRSVGEDYNFDDLYLEKIEAGLDVLQNVMLLLAWMLIEDDELKTELKSLGVQKAQVLAVLKGYESELVFNYENSDEEMKKDQFDLMNMVRELLANLD